MPGDSPRQNIAICRDFRSGANRDRTGDLLLAKQALSQLSYGPETFECREAPVEWLLVEVEIPRRTLLEPQALLLRRVAKKVRRLL